jgi:hypothetical protein
MPGIWIVFLPRYRARLYIGRWFLTPPQYGYKIRVEGKRGMKSEF